jgi:uncharacterized membrane protein YdjX (TVP38/TMEM64 family)
MSARHKSLYLAGAMLAMAAVVAAAVWLPVGEYLISLADRVRATGPWGPLLLGAVYVLATLCFAPAWPLTILAGFLFGLVKAAVTVSLASVTGAAAAFALGRSVARGLVQRKFAHSQRFQAIDAAVHREGLKIVFLVRLSPVFPYVLTNYLFSLTSIRFRDFLLASWIGMLPGTILYVYLGTTAESIAEIARGNYRRGPAQTALFVLGLLATILVTVLVTRTARASLRRAAPLDSSADE